jgi:transketolase
MEQTARTNKDLIQALETMGNKLRIHSIVATSEAGSGHPTSCMSAADLTAAVFFYAMRYEVANPKNPVNDRFVLSKGHAAPLLYAAWAEAGAFPVERLKTLVPSQSHGMADVGYHWTNLWFAGEQKNSDGCDGDQKLCQSDLRSHRDPRSGV